MKLLVSGCTETVADWHSRRPDRLGALLTPQAGNDPPANMLWAADNGCFGGLDHVAWLRFLAKIKLAKNPPLWVCCPDVVADMGATWKAFSVWQPVLAELGLPVALVLQDGLELFKWRARLHSTWDLITGVFVGGSTAFKLSRFARETCCEAKARGKLVHVGRVNTRERIERIASWGCVDTFDGSGFSKWGKIRIPLGIRWVDIATNRIKRGSIFDCLE